MKVGDLVRYLGDLGLIVKEKQERVWIQWLALQGKEGPYCYGKGMFIDEVHSPRMAVISESR